MKTNIISILCLSALALSCSTTTYRMNTVIDRDGSVVREIQTTADSAFLAGDMSANPFLFDMDGSWEIAGCDSANIVTIRKRAASIEGLSEGLRHEDHNRSLAAPAESLKKRFRWFYTYYDFKAVYPETVGKGSVPLDSYLDAQEQALWFRGDMSPYAGLNGVELKSALDEIEDNFFAWCNRSMYEICFDVVAGLAQDSPYSARLAEAKEKIYAANIERMEFQNITVEDFCEIADNYFSTDYFSTFYNGNKETVDRQVEAETSVFELFDSEISYLLTMPGEVISTNAPLSDNGTLEWQVDAWRVLAADYALTAQSRAPNYWAWFITLLVVVSPVCFFVRAGKKKK